MTKNRIQALSGKRCSGHKDRTGGKMQIKVLFLGSLTEITRTDVRHYNNINSFGDLKHRVEDEFPGIMHYCFRIAVNYELISNTPQLNDGDEVAYLPCFAKD